METAFEGVLELKDNLGRPLIPPVLNCYVGSLNLLCTRLMA